jgi:arsenate reductase
MKQRVLFICNRNAGRSQIAEGLMRKRFGDRYEAYSAGMNPSSSVNSYTVRVMEEAGIALAHQRPKSLQEFVDMHFDYIVFMCENTQPCAQVPPAHQVMYMEFSDPARFVGSEDEILEGFRALRNSIGDWLEATFGGP